MNGRAALITGADDSPVRRATSTRETGPQVSTSSNTVAVAGLVIWTLPAVLRCMPGTVDQIINVVNILFQPCSSLRCRPSCPLIVGEPFVPPSPPAIQFTPALHDVLLARGLGRPE